MRSFVAALGLFLAISSAPLRSPAEPTGPQTPRQALVLRLRALATKECHWGAAWQPIYRAALPWYERWGNPPHPVDAWMSSPEAYAEELASALEQNRNLFAEHPDALIPLAFTARLPDGRSVEANYWLTLPAGFPQEGRRFPLVIGLHGSGWLGHKISFVHQARKDPSGGRAFTVTPINAAGPWQIDFLNAYLDELLRFLPVDADHVYLEGHSLGAMATWEWSLSNPERFAAISPRSGRGEPYRASRLCNVPAWVIHGEKDEIVPAGFSDQMAAALEACGGPVRYTVLPGIAHNLPDDFDQTQVVDWYLRQSRSHEPAPPDPRDELGIGAEGFSPWTIRHAPATPGWRSESVPLSDSDAARRATTLLFDQVHAAGSRAETSVIWELDSKSGQAHAWLAVPPALSAAPGAAPTMTFSGGRSLCFYFRGPTNDALAHLARVTTEAHTIGYRVQEDKVWITPLSLWSDTPGYLAEYRLSID